MQQFFTPAQFCYDLTCNQVLIPWVLEFEELPLNAAIAILYQDYGEFKPGLYTKIQGYWLLALNYDDLSASIGNTSNFKIVLGVTSPQIPPVGSAVFRNGFRVPDGTNLTPGQIAWVVVHSSGAVSTLVVTDIFGTLIGNFLVN